MHMSAFAVNADAGVTHHGDDIALLHFLAHRHAHRAEMTVKTVVAGGAPAMLNHDVTTVVGKTGDRIHMHDLAPSDGMNFVRRIAVLVTMQGTDIDAFV